MYIHGPLWCVSVKTWNKIIPKLIASHLFHNQVLQPPQTLFVFPIQFNSHINPKPQQRGLILSWVPRLLSLRMNISFAYTILVQIVAPLDSGLSFHLVVSLVYVCDICALVCRSCAGSRHLKSVVSILRKGVQWSPWDKLSVGYGQQSGQRSCLGPEENKTQTSNIEFYSVGLWVWFECALVFLSCTKNVWNLFFIL